MDEAKQKQVKTLGLIVLAIVGIGAAVYSGVTSLSPPKENIVGSLDGTGPGSTVAPRGMRDAAAGEGRPAGEERPVGGR